ncbi:hypothetical protein Vretimale_8084 [Volvox reticuliferus]|uniref:Glycosyltransferase family 92 protein n=1 Tax=Volvox reticuliferus TaxID=1737510 RepID=A0A8J4GAI1_9CHLO|nr:hypothetical protein Vretifemale_5234 [Volvox reticuliferus]GIM03337.1 hypothetical protein Vretimale_8084 [Volvox reticuliferus]
MQYFLEHVSLPGLRQKFGLYTVCWGLLTINWFLFGQILLCESAKKHFSTSLGVYHARLFAKAPVSGQEKVITLNLWLKRISWGRGTKGAASAFLLPTQTDAVEGFAWADDIGNLTNNKYGLYMTTVDAPTWKPLLRLQLWGSDLVVPANPHPALDAPGGKPLGPPWSHLRPFFFSFPLDAASSVHCFKIYEESFPDIKAPFCLPISSVELCNRLAPDSSFTPSQPALWTVMLPFRSWGINGSQWERYSQRVANRLQHAVTYLRSVGATGMLLYTERFSSHALERYPIVQQMLQEGILIFVEWEHNERLQYNSDQALVYSHALLGLSSCGTNLWVQATDVDELLYSPYGVAWPGMFECLSNSSGSDAPGLIRLGRINIIASSVGADREAVLWYSAPNPGGKHPLAYYDKIAKLAHPANVGKYIACPARRIVAVWMHTALPIHGTFHEGNARCALIFHIPNYWGPRVKGDADNYDRFRSYLPAQLRMRPG